MNPGGMGFIFNREELLPGGRSGRVCNTGDIDAFENIFRIALPDDPNHRAAKVFERANVLRKYCTQDWVCGREDF